MNDRKCVRLACSECDREDGDGITPEDLDRLSGPAGWVDVREIQTFEQSMTTPADDDPARWPADYRVLDWFTHLGRCPDCRRTET